MAKAEKIEMIHELLSDVIRSGTGKRAFIENDAAGKTGQVKITVMPGLLGILVI